MIAMGEYYKRIIRSIICFYVSVITTVVIIFFVYYDAYGKYMTTMLKPQDEKAQYYTELNKTQEHGLTVFFGDSLTELCDTEKYYPDIPNVNRGISGDTTSGMLKRVEDNVIAIQPVSVVFLGGINDIGHGVSIETVLSNIDKILMQLSTSLPDCRVLVESLYPVNSHKKPAFLNAVGIRTNEAVLAVNSVLPDICSKYNATFVNIHNLLTDEDGNLDKRYTMDGLHVNDKGYEIITAEINRYLKTSDRD